MKKIMVVMLAFVVAIVSVMGALAQADECIDCCDEGSPCYGEEAGTPTLDVYECEVQINGRTVKPDVEVLKAFERGEELEVEVEFVSQQDAEEVQVLALMTGYHRGHKLKEQIFDITPTFDVEANVAYKKTLNLKLPEDFDLDTGDELKIRVEIEDKFANSYVKVYNLKVEALRHKVEVQDILLDPSSRVQAGRGLFASVRVKNFGEDQEEDVKITVEIPELDLKATEYIDELDEDEATTSEDMFLRLPVCTEAGTYVVTATVEYADGDEEVSEETTIEVLENPECGAIDEVEKEDGDKTVVTVPGRQDVIKGSAGTVYPVILENRGSTDRSYELSASGLDSWATYRFDPGAFVLVRAGETQTVYLYVTSNEDAPTGEKVFIVNVETAGDTKQIALTANVVEGDREEPSFEFGSLRRIFEVGLIVLVVLLVVLGLIIGFSKLKGDEEEPGEVSGQTYY